MNHTDDIDIYVSVAIQHYKSVMPNTLVNTVCVASVDSMV